MFDDDAVFQHPFMRPFRNWKENDIMQLNLTDVSPTSGVGDTLSVSVQRSKGGLWFSSNWDGAKTVEKTILSGGNLSVK